MDPQPPSRDHGADMLRLFNEIRGKLDEANATLVSHIDCLAALAKHDNDVQLAELKRANAALQARVEELEAQLESKVVSEDHYNYLIIAMTEELQQFVNSAKAEAKAKDKVKK